MQTRSSRITPTQSRGRLRVPGLLTLSAAIALSLSAQTASLTAVPTRDQKVVRRWKVDGDPRGVAIGKDGTIYVGLAASQSIIAVDPKTGAIKNRLVLDSADIAATKELVTLRMNADRTRLYIANGSDESATILSLPNMAVVREITLEGEPIRDALPDPKGRYLYLLGRRVHVFDADGKKELRRIDVDDSMAIAALPNVLAIVGSETFGTTNATVVALYDAETFAELAREPLQTEDVMHGAMFAGNGRALVALGTDHVYEKPLSLTPAKVRTMETNATGGMRMTIDFGDLVNSNRVCFPELTGPQGAVLNATDDLLVLAERRCSTSGAFSGSNRRVTPASLYNVNAYALAYDRDTNSVVATEPAAGFLTIYKVPRPAVVR